MEGSDLGVLISSGVGSGALTILGRDLFRFLRTRGKDRKDENAREDKRLSDCEQRFATLSTDIKELQADMRSILLEKVVESAQAMTMAAEVQREGNIVTRELSGEIKRLVSKIEKNTPPNGNPVQHR